MIVLSIHFNELRIKILADLAEDIAETLNGISIKQFAPVFSYEDQMYMQIKYTMPAVSYVLPFVHRPSIVCVMSIACNVINVGGERKSNDLAKEHLGLARDAQKDCAFWFRVSVARKRSSFELAGLSLVIITSVGHAKSLGMRISKV